MYIRMHIYIYIYIRVVLHFSIYVVSEAVIVRYYIYDHISYVGDV